MKKVFIFICLVALIFSSCGKPKMIDGKMYKTVGLIEMHSKSNVANDYSKDIEYEVCWGNVIWGCVLAETIIAPIYFFGFSMFNPIEKVGGGK